MKSPRQIKYDVGDKATLFVVWGSVICSGAAFWVYSNGFTFTAFAASVLAGVLTMKVWR